MCSKSHSSIDILECSTLIVWRTYLDMVSAVPNCALPLVEVTMFLFFEHLFFFFFFSYNLFNGKLQTDAQDNAANMFMHN